MSKFYNSLWLCGKILCHFVFEIISSKGSRAGLKNVSLLGQLVSFILQTKENLRFLLISRQESFKINRSFFTFYHLLYMFNFRVVGSVLFGDVISDASLTIRFSSGSTGLQVKFLALCLQGLQTICGPARMISVDRCTHSSTGAVWAGVDKSIQVIKHGGPVRCSIYMVSDSLGISSGAFRNSSEVSSILNVSGPKLSCLIDRSKECVVHHVFRVFRPVSLHTSSNRIYVSINREEMIDSRLLILFTRAGAWMDFNFEALHLGDSRRGFESLAGASNSVMSGVDWYTNNNIILELANIHKTCEKIVSREVHFSLSSSMPNHLQLKNLLLIQHRCKMGYTTNLPLKCCGTFLVNLKVLEKTKYQFSFIPPELFICFYAGGLEMEDNQQPCADNTCWSPIMIFHGYDAHFLSSHHIHRQKEDRGNEILFESSSYFMSNYTLCTLSISVVHLEQQHRCLPVLLCFCKDYLGMNCYFVAM